MNYEVQPRLPYLEDPDYLQAFTAEVASVTGPVIETTLLSYGKVGVEATPEQAQELASKPLIGSVKGHVDWDMSTQRTFLARVTQR